MICDVVYTCVLYTGNKKRGCAIQASHFNCNDSWFSICWIYTCQSLLKQYCSHF